MVRYSVDQSNLLYVTSEVERMGEELDVTIETQKDAVRLCGQVIRSDYNFVSVDALAGTCMYLACTRQDEPVALGEIAEVSRKSQKNIQHLASNLMNELEIKLMPVNPESFLEEAVDHFDLSEDQRETCFTLLERGKEHNLHSGLAPTTVAGGIIYAVTQLSDLDLNQSEIADHVGKSTVSIRNAYRDFLVLADGVTMSTLPPEAYKEITAEIAAECEEHPNRYKTRADSLIARMERDPPAQHVPSVAAAAYYEVASQNGHQLSYEQLESIVGPDDNAEADQIKKYHDRISANGSGEQ